MAIDEEDEERIKRIKGKDQLYKQWDEKKRDPDWEMREQSESARTREWAVTPFKYYLLARAQSSARTHRMPRRVSDERSDPDSTIHIRQFAKNLDKPPAIRTHQFHTHLTLYFDVDVIDGGVKTTQPWGTKQPVG